MRVHVASLVYDSKAKNAVKIIALDYTPAQLLKLAGSSVMFV